MSTSKSAFAVLAGSGSGDHDGQVGPSSGSDNAEEGAGAGREVYEAKFEDVTDRLRQSCASMGTGGILKNPDFTLHDSMAALELFSPKMDSGMGPKLVTVRERVESGSLSIPPATDLELVVICDLIAAMEVAYYDGHSLATSVHSCVFLSHDAFDILNDQCSALKQRIVSQGSSSSSTASKGETRKKSGRFRGIREEDSDSLVLSFAALALFTSICKSCSEVRNTVQLAYMFEEEDFSASHHGLPLGKDFSPEECDQLLDQAAAALAARRDKLVALDNADDAANRILSIEGSCALLKMVAFRRAYLAMLCEMIKPDCKGIRKGEKLAKEAALLWADGAGPCKRADASKVSSALAAARCRCSLEDGKSSADSYAVLDPDINRSALAASPPRAGPPSDLAAAHVAFAKLLDDVQEVCELNDQSTLSGLFVSLEDLAESEPCIVPRSMAVSMLYGESKLALGKYDYSDLIATNMYEFGIPVLDIETESGKNFCLSLVKPVYDMLCMLAANLARQRREIANQLPAWAEIQQEANTQDQLVLFDRRPDLAGANNQELTNMDNDSLGKIFFFSITAWSTEWTSRLMQKHLELGFRLELYAPQELEIMTWYYGKVCDRRASNWAAMSEYLSKHMQAIATAQDPPTADGRKPFDILRRQLNDVRESESSVRRNLICSMHKDMADGLLRALIALRIQGRLPKPAFEFGSEEIRYNHRFAPYASIQNPALFPYSLFASMSDQSNYTDAQLLNAAKSYFDHCRETAGAFSKQLGSAGSRKDKHLKAQLLSIGKAAVINNLTVGQAMKMPTDAEKIVVIDSELNPKFPVLKLATRPAKSDK